MSPTAMRRKLPIVEAAPAIDWPAIRRRYPATRESVFLNGGSRGLLSENAHAAGVASLAADRLMQLDQPSADVQLAELRGLFELLIRAEAGSVAVTANVSHGLNMVATAIDWQPGDEVITVGDLEHANNIYLWQGLTAKGVVIRDIPAKDGAADADAMIAAISPRTRLITVSAVSLVPCFRADMARIGMAARKADVLFLVDAVQATGVLEVDVGVDCIDALATSTSKGLLGVRGLGFLYVSPRWTERLKPAFVARNSIAAKGHYSQIEAGPFAFRADARRFECGNYNYVGVAIARTALLEILDLGIANIEDQSVRLAGQLADGLSALGFAVAAPPAGQRRTHLVTLGERGDGGPEATGDARLDAFSQALDAAGVKHATRRRMLRFGFHFYNDESDVDAVLTVARKLA
ncbi:MAG: aminotransferase class V-fold PLP-dependent enzyme [Beijerinckiaceae bacterium]